MRAYVGQTRSSKWIATLNEHHIGECLTRGDCWPPRRTPWFYDNGAFGDWLRGRAFDVAAFERDLLRIHEAAVRPDFIVCPDIVAGGRASLEFSLAWRDRLRSACPGQRVYLVVQDGMTERDLPIGIGCDFNGVFVGGSMPWKLETAQQWVRYAHRNALPCHVGRVGPGARVRWARLISADSIDSSLPLRGDYKLQLFLDSLTGPGPMRQYRGRFDRDDLATPRQGRLPV